MHSVATDQLDPKHTLLLQANNSRTGYCRVQGALCKNVLTGVGMQLGPCSMSIPLSLGANLLLGKEPVKTSFKKECIYTAPMSERSHRTAVAPSTASAPLSETFSKRDSLEAYCRRPICLTSMCEDRFQRSYEWKARAKPIFVEIEDAQQKLAVQPSVFVDDVEQFDVNRMPETADDNALGRLMLLGLPVEGGVSCYGIADPRSYNMSELRMSLKPIPFVFAQLDSDSYCASILRRFVPYRNWKEDFAPVISGMLLRSITTLHTCMTAVVRAMKSAADLLRTLMQPALSKHTRITPLKHSMRVYRITHSLQSGTVPPFVICYLLSIVFAGTTYRCSHAFMVSSSMLERLRRGIARSNPEAVSFRYAANVLRTPAPEHASHLL